MSLKVINRVWDKSKVGGTTMIILLALADIADDEGYCYPSLAALGKRVHQSVDLVSEMLEKLEKLNEIRRIWVDTPSKDKALALYQVISGLTLGEIAESEERSALFRHFTSKR